MLIFEATINPQELGRTAYPQNERTVRRMASHGYNDPGVKSVQRSLTIQR